MTSALKPQPQGMRKKAWPCQLEASILFGKPHTILSSRRSHYNTRTNLREPDFISLPTKLRHSKCVDRCSTVQHQAALSENPVRHLQFLRGCKALRLFICCPTAALSSAGRCRDFGFRKGSKTILALLSPKLCRVCAAELSRSRSHTGFSFFVMEPRGSP